ncbi:hypothetical protein J0X14_18215 [Muricauda sp. CAU 1633]|uniref:hypothetical protein n=1 Tax=Allomuricauda sp. CAU 1633 TaxID=2816036 RepID=UPI001A8DAAB7|nr:hypothetical protein [Muricauda sp. CAU 1633]MBO0324251.1 hypothetical protein [Muricauda sp. CAU 1633]
MKYLSVLILLYCLFSCNSEESIEGSWIYSYDLFSDGSIHYSPNPISILAFYQDSVVELIVGNKKYEFEDQNNTHRIEKKGSVLNLGDTYKLNLDSIKGDSLLLTPSRHTSSLKYKMIYKKLPKKYKKMDWLPVGKSYKFKNWKSETIVMDFNTDTTLVEHSKISKTNIRDWELTSLDGYSFLIITYLEPTATLIDSITADKVFVTYYGPKVHKFVFEEINN